MIEQIIKKVVDSKENFKKLYWAYPIASELQKLNYDLVIN
jgi:hypothetical protein